MSKKQQTVSIQYQSMETQRLDIALMGIAFVTIGIVRDVIGGFGQDTKVGTVALAKQLAIDAENRLRIRVF